MTSSLDFMRPTPLPGFASSGVTTAMLPPPVKKKPVIPTTVSAAPTANPIAPIAPMSVSSPVTPTLPQIKAPTPSGTNIGGVSLKSGLSSTQISGLQTLAQKPSDQWSATDKQNWAYATGGGSMPTFGKPTVPGANGGSGGATTPPTTPPVTPPIAPSADSTTPTAPAPSSYETADKTAQDAYQKSLLLSPEEQAAQADLDRLQESYKKAYTGIGDQTIPLDFITGQQRSVEQRALGLAEPLQTRLARMQAERTASKEAAQFGLSRADQQLAAEKTAAAAKATAERDASKPFNVNPGDNVVRLNPATGKYETVFYSAPKALTPGEKYGSGTIGEYNFYKDQEEAAGRTPKSFDEYRTMDENRKAKAAAITAGGLNTSQQTAAFKLVDDYEKASGDLPKVISNFNKVTAAAQNPSAAGDLSLIFAYMKMLDPTSVVREGEFATAQNAAGVPTQIANVWNKAVNGERLSEFQRTDFINQSSKLYQAALSQQKQIDTTFSDRAGKFGVPADLVIRDQSSYMAEPSGGGNTNDPLGLFSSVPSMTVNGSANKIAAAIKHVESGGNYGAKGESGEGGAYQFMPESWKAWAGQYLGNSNAKQTPQNQDMVAQARIGDLLSKGYNAHQIALIWNGGQPIVKKGVNKYGVAYDSGAYANKVIGALKNLS